MNFRSVADLNACVVSFLPSLPRDIDLVVGIPRSGLLAANLVALHLNAAMTDLEGFIAARVLSMGTTRRPSAGLNGSIDEFKRVLMVDDSIFTGAAMREARSKIAASPRKQEIIYAAVYVAPAARREVDLAFEIVPMPRFFEWNIMHHPSLAVCCMDIDGVLCNDPLQEQNDDGPEYLEFLKCASLKFLPTVKVGWLVTCRLEKYRRQTEEWLRQQGVPFGELIMLDLPDKESRADSGCHGQFKASVFRRTRAQLFIESDLAQAVDIANRAGKPVYCVGTAQMIQPGLKAATIESVRSLPRRMFGLLHSAAWRTKNQAIRRLR